MDTQQNRDVPRIKKGKHFLNGQENFDSFFFIKNIKKERNTIVIYFFFFFFFSNESRRAPKRYWETLKTRDSSSSFSLLFAEIYIKNKKEIIIRRRESLRSRRRKGDRLWWMSYYKRSTFHLLSFPYVLYIRQEKEGKEDMLYYTVGYILMDNRRVSADLPSLHIYNSLLFGPSLQQRRYIVTERSTTVQHWKESAK